jgi:hypothetical protein
MPRKGGRKRDYSAEYRRRIKKALSKGLSRSQARGHRRAHEQPTSNRTKSRALADNKLQLGLRLLRTEGLSKSAKQAQISPEKLRRYAVEKGILEKRGRRWIIRKDVPRRLLIYSDAKEHAITVAKFRTASLIGEYMAAVRWFVQTNDLRHLEPFTGKSVKDISGKRFPLETRPNVLHRLANSGGSSFEDIYRLVI